MLNTPLSPWPAFSADEAEAVKEVLLSNRVNYWTGEHGRHFEYEFAAFTGSDHAVALSNGSVAIEAALKAIGIRAGDEVIVPSKTFIATASAVVMVGAKPVFADVDLNSQNITAAAIRSVLSPCSKAIICVHLAGMPCEMDDIMELAARHKLYVIEDCAQAHGARYRGRSVGSIGHIGCWSFCQDKIMTTGGEGGMITTNDKKLWQSIWSYKDHGKSYSAVYETEHPPGFRWLHDDFGTNARMTEMQAVLGRMQLKKLADWNSQRRSNSEQIWQAARSIAALRCPQIPEYIEHAYYKCYVFVRSEYLKPDWSRDRIRSEIQRHGIPCYEGSCSEIYREKAFTGTDLAPQERLPHARELAATSLMFLVHPTLTPTEMKKTCHVLTEVMSLAGQPQTTSS